ncbi:MAG: GNAT family N-acetyltransferase [Chloroflexi bacterium]|nr:GNAT family N-acetyltransferase [Chloroflexota bacterium]
MTNPTDLTTERLLLRPFRLSDIDDVLRYGSDPEWAEFYSRPYERGAAEHMVAQAVLASWDKGARFAIVLKDRVIGVVSLDVDSEDQTAELGYDVARDMWGRGIATEATAAVCDWGFRQYGLAKIYAAADARNTRSLRVMKKLGMARDGTLRSEVMGGTRVDAAYYSVLRDEWSRLVEPLPPIPAPIDEYDSTDRGELRELTTRRLLLRPLEPGDVDGVFAFTSDPEWARHLLDEAPRPYTRRDAEEVVARHLLDSPDTRPSWAIVLDGACVGIITLSIDARHETGELHYALAKSNWGKGLMPEAAGAVIDWGFRRRGLAKIWARTDAEHRQSRRVMEKLGMQCEGLARDHYKAPGTGRSRVDVVFYRVLSDEWEQADA